MKVFRDWDSIKTPQKYLGKADLALDQEEKSLTSCASFGPCILSPKLAKGLKCNFWLDLAEGYSSPAVLIRAQSLIWKVVNPKLSFENTTWKATRKILVLHPLYKIQMKDTTWTRWLLFHKRGSFLQGLRKVFPPTLGLENWNISECQSSSLGVMWHWYDICLSILILKQ